MKSDKQIKEIVDKANLLLNEKDFKGALPLFEELSEIFIDHFHTLYNISLCYFQLEDFKKTRDLLEDMDKKFPLNTQINFLKGFCYEKENDFVKANEFYKKALKIDKTHFDSWIRSAACNRAQKNYDNAINLFSYAYTNFGNRFDVLQDLILTLLEKGDLEKAMSILEEYTSKDPDNKLAKQYLAQVYHQIPGKKQLAIDIETEISGKIDFNE